MSLDVIDPRQSIEEQAANMRRAGEDIGFFLVPVAVLDRLIVDDAWQVPTLSPDSRSSRPTVWHAVEPDPEMFVVNLGDSIAQWTNDRWRSTMHRVAATSEQPRQSFAFFHMANWDATIECLRTCLEPGESPKHPPVQAGPWLMGKFWSTVS